MRVPFLYRTKTAVALVAVLTLGTAVAADLRERAQTHFQPIPAASPPIEGNTITPEKIELGRMLFFEPRLSLSGTISCNTCHNLALGGSDNLPTSVGHAWTKGPRNTPSIFNVVLNPTLLWEGRDHNLGEQAKIPATAQDKMHSSQKRVEAVLKASPEYVEHFGKAFPEEAQPVSFDNMGKALEAFEATLLTPGSRFDRWLAGDDQALNDQEIHGLALFLDKECVDCHNGANLGGNDYHPFGVVERLGASLLPPNDKGRFEVTKTATDKYVFRASPLRNVALTAPYFHSGQVWSLKQAVAIMGAFQLGISLNDEEEEAITAFLRTLTGELPRVEYPILPPSTRETPRPEP
jgi:cytochrome c peroxidase